MHNAESTTDAFACTLCGCLCDDLRITTADGRITQAKHACGLAESWLLGQRLDEQGAAQVDGRPASLDEALERAAAILRTSRAPLIFGLTRCGTDGQRAAVALADRIGATIDVPASSLPLTLALQEVGQSSCSFAEVRQRADLIVLWGADPVVKQPRLLERLLLAPVCDPLESDRVVLDQSRRTVVAVDLQRTASAELADRFVPIQEGRHFETICALRGLVREPPLAVFHQPEAQARASLARVGMEPADLQYLAGRMKECRFGVVFFGRGLSQDGARTVEALLRLAAELNDRTRFYALGLLSDAPGGAENVLAWQTGYPCGVNFGRGFPRSNPGEFSAEKLLENQEVDACLLVGSDASAYLSRTAAAHLERLPTIILDPAGTPMSRRADVRFVTAVPGIHIPGTAYRLDGVALPLQAVLPEIHPRPAAVLQRIGDRLQEGNVIAFQSPSASEV